MENENADQARISNFTAASTRSTPEETVHIEYFEVPLEEASGGLIASVANQVSSSHSVQSPITTGILTEGECRRGEEHFCLNGNQHQVYSSPQPSTNEDLCSRQDQDQAKDSDSSNEGEGISVDELKQTDGYRLFVEALNDHSTKE